jgi:hypothetical protein
MVEKSVVQDTCDRSNELGHQYDKLGCTGRNTIWSHPHLCSLLAPPAPFIEPPLFSLQVQGTTVTDNPFFPHGGCVALRHVSQAGTERTDTYCVLPSPTRKIDAAFSFLFFSFALHFSGCRFGPSPLSQRLFSFSARCTKAKARAAHDPCSWQSIFFVCLENGWHGALDLGEIRK